MILMGSLGGQNTGSMIRSAESELFTGNKNHFKNRQIFEYLSKVGMIVRSEF